MELYFSVPSDGKGLEMLNKTTSNTSQFQKVSCGIITLITQVIIPDNKRHVPLYGFMKMNRASAIPYS
jgi:hypothetical protein